MAEYSALSFLTTTNGTGFISDAKTYEVNKRDVTRMFFIILVIKIVLYRQT